MKTAVVSLNPRSKKLAEKILDKLGTEAELYHQPPYPLGNWISEHWKNYDAWIFILPLGIVLRTISPLIESKYHDPAVVTVDEMGRYFISTLSGHEGGANRLANDLATALGGEAVITTATEACKNLVVGVGCRRGVSKDLIINAINQALDAAGKNLGEVRVLASIDLKSGESGLLEAAHELGLSINFISREWLKNIPLDYEPSVFVEEKIGIGGVAQPCALLGGKRTRIILPKTKFNQVTIAIAEESSSW